MSTNKLRDEMAAFRAKHKLDQRGFAKGAGLSKSYLQHVERGRKQPSEEVAERIRHFMESATDETIASLRGPGIGNSPSKVRRGRKLRRDELDRVDLNRSGPDDVDDELEDILKGF